MLKYNPPIVIHDGIKSVSNGEYSASFELLSDGVLDEVVRLHVDGGRGLVQNEHLGLPEQRPRQTHQLPLTHAAG